MRGLERLFALPPTLLAAIFLPYPAGNGQALPFGLQAHEKYFPEHAEHLRRNWETQQKLGERAPAGVRKMSDDAGQKFLFEYWEFDRLVMNIAPSYEDSWANRGSSRFHELEQSVSNSVNDTLPDMLPPLLLHTEKYSTPNPLRFLERSLFKRSYTCPGGTTSCAAIGQPNSCCESGETCINVSDAANGPVGCCPSGETCADGVADCDTGAGYTSCPDSSNGGCCIPGYSCQDVGCR